jgi:2-polyprenyl-3-methyl-5-hydroxy-6-metoxy-1,4-benzoquinol methylase
MLSKYFDSENNILPEYRQEVSCGVCYLNNFERKFNLNGFIHNKCNNCGTLFVSPRLSDAALSELYGDAYYSEFYQNSLLGAFELRKEKIGKSKTAQIFKYCKLNTIGKYLDIGAGIGEVPDVFKDLSWVTHVIEMNPVAIEWLKTRNHKSVFHGDFEDYRTNEKFDLITAWGVVEHLVDPDAFLSKVFDLIEPDGVFVSEVPHADSLLVNFTQNTGIDPERILMGEQHVVLHSKRAYEDLHKRNGFELVHIQTNGLDFSTITKVCNLNIPRDIIFQIQKSIDDNFNGDLLRGFWRKSSKVKIVGDLGVRGM